MTGTRTNRVLHLIDSAGMYGAEQALLTLLKGLQESSYRPILGCIRESARFAPEIGKRAAQSGIEVEYFTMRRGLNPVGAHTIVRFMQDSAIKAIHSHGYKPTIFLGLWPWSPPDTFLIATVQGWAKADSAWKGRAYELLERLCLRRMDRVVAVSHGIRDDLRKSGLSDNKITVIHNAIEPNDPSPITSPQDTKQALGLAPDHLLLINIARLSNEKGHLFLLEAVRQVVRIFPNVTLLCVGDGPLLPRLQTWVKDLGLQRVVKLTGYRADVPSLLAIADIFVLASNTEGLPLALLEAVAMGKPVVATNVGGIPEVITDGEWTILVSPRDSRALAHALSTLLQRKHNHPQAPGEKLTHLPETFTHKHLIAQHIALYDSLILRTY